jgi:hypothetical protein
MPSPRHDPLDKLLKDEEKAAHQFYRAKQAYSRRGGLGTERAQPKPGNVIQPNAHSTLPVLVQAVQWLLPVVTVFAAGYFWLCWATIYMSSNWAIAPLSALVIWWAVCHLTQIPTLGLPATVSTVLTTLFLLWIITYVSSTVPNRKLDASRKNRIFHSIANVTVDWSSTIMDSDQAMVLPLALTRSGTEIGVFHRRVQRSQLESKEKEQLDKMLTVFLSGLEDIVWHLVDFNDARLWIVDRVQLELSAYDWRMQQIIEAEANRSRLKTWITAFVYNYVVLHPPPPSIDAVYNTTSDFLGVLSMVIREEFIAEGLQLHNELKAMRRDLGVIDGIYGTGIDKLDSRIRLEASKKEDNRERKTCSSWFSNNNNNNNKEFNDDYDWLIEQRTSLKTFESSSELVQNNLGYANVIYKSIQNNLHHLQVELQEPGAQKDIDLKTLQAMMDLVRNATARLARVKEVEAGKRREVDMRVRKTGEPWVLLPGEATKG